MAEYILRPALLDKFYKEQNAYYEHGREFSYSFLHGNNISAEWWTIEQMVEDIPAADVRPVVRATWNTVKYPLYECSNCGAVYQDVGYGFNFCPNCGAWMGDMENEKA